MGKIGIIPSLSLGEKLVSKYPAKNINNIERSR
jgi:hypothetical protein